MFANKQNKNLPKIKCIITGQVQPSRAWYHCQVCIINYSIDIFNEYDGWLRRPRCAFCAANLTRKTVSIFAPHRRR